MTPVRLEPVALGSRVKHSTTEPLRYPKKHFRKHNISAHLYMYSKTWIRRQPKRPTKIVFKDRLSLNAGVKKIIPVQKNLPSKAIKKADKNWFSGLIIA